MKVMWHVARVLLGLVFIFSGFVKGIDPWGSAYKFTDYFNAWGMESLTSFSFTLGVLLSALEFVTGVALLVNVFISFFSRIALIFMAFFTALTLYIAIYNPVTDCGCFGDALVLTNWETFYKNIFFLALALVILFFREKYNPKYSAIIPAILAGATLFVYAYFVNYSYNHLPIIDFRPYKIGSNIPDGMIVPDDAPKDIYENIFYYKNKETGKEKKFTEENYPWQDTLTWEFASMDSKQIQKGYEAPIHNFTIETPDGEDIKDFFLYDENYTFMLVCYNLDKASLSNFAAINELSEFALNENFNFFGLTSTSFGESEQFRVDNNVSFEFFNCDEITLKTIVRSNPGLVLLKNGTIIDKWHFNDIPTVDEFEKEKAYLEKINPS